MVAPIPVDRYLVPEPAAQPPDGFTRVESRLASGLPHAVALSATERLLVVAPTGIARAWRDADPSLVVSDASLERAPRQDGSPLALAPLARVPFRLLYQVNRRTVGSAPLVANRVARVPEAGGARARLEIVAIDWRLHAGTLRGAGDYGSFVSIAWRAADAAVSAFSEPLPNPVFVQRQPPERRMQSLVGYSKRSLNLEAWIRARAALRVVIK